MYLPFHEFLTLSTVTADHSHTMTISGYPKRGEKILGGFENDIKSIPYLTLSYANGPGAIKGVRESPYIRGNPLDDKDFMQDATVELEFESHGGEDVAIYAQGPHSHLFRSLHDNHYVFYAVLYAGCFPLDTLPRDLLVRMHYAHSLPRGAHCNGASAARGAAAALGHGSAALSAWLLLFSSALFLPRLLKQLIK